MDILEPRSGAPGSAGVSPARGYYQRAGETPALPGTFEVAVTVHY